MAKVNIKNMIVDKGERYAVAVAAALMVLLMGIGIYNLTDSPDPKEIVGAVDKSTQKINSTINSGGKIDPLPAFAKADYPDTVVKAGEMPNRFFDPINPPDKRRINPILLALVDMQADYVAGKILSYDIREQENGELEIGVIVARAGKKDNTDDKEARTAFLKDIGVRLTRNRPNPDNPRGWAGGAGMGLMGGPRPPGGGIMGGPSPMGMPMGASGAGIMGRGPIGPAVNLGMRGVGMTGGTAATQHDSAPRMGIEYVPLDPDKLEGKRLALTILPQRMIVVQAAFPYKAELEQIQTALRLEKLSDVLKVEDASPVFKGYVIERQVLTLDGKLDVDWQPLNVEEKYRETIYPRKFGDKEDDQFLQKVMLPPEHELTMPLPQLLMGDYPPNHLPQLQSAIQKMKALDKPVELTQGTDEPAQRGGAASTVPLIPAQWRLKASPTSAAP